jgi:hypothetical protein
MDRRDELFGVLKVRGEGEDRFVVIEQIEGVIPRDHQQALEWSMSKAQVRQCLNGMGFTDTEVDAILSACLRGRCVGEPGWWPRNLVPLLDPVAALPTTEFDQFLAAVDGHRTGQLKCVPSSSEGETDLRLLDEVCSLSDKELEGWRRSIEEWRINHFSRQYAALTTDELQSRFVVPSVTMEMQAIYCLLVRRGVQVSLPNQDD